jgi:hypothetical protein
VPLPLRNMVGDLGCFLTCLSTISSALGESGTVLGLGDPDDFDVLCRSIER